MRTLRPVSVLASFLLLGFCGLPALADGPTDPPDKGGTRPEALSLPTGPGSLAGMGEAVKAEPATGALTLSIPIALPPAPTGVGPDLTLRYDSRAGNGPLGIGWSLPLPSLQRRTDLGLPRYDRTDQLLWSGKQLVEIAPGSYRPRVEGEFTRVVALAAGYRVDLRDGSKMTLGSSGAAQVVEGRRVFRWLPEKVVSVHGDVATYSYLADGTQRYLSEIDYGRAGAPPARVMLRYEARPDPLPDGRATFLVTTALRLAEIDTFVEDTPVRTTKLSYDDKSGLSRLESAQTCAADGTTCFPALSLTVSQPVLTQATPLQIGPPGVWLGDPDTALLDVDGDSLPDVVQVTSTGTTWWPNLGASGFGAGRPVSAAPGVNLSSAGVALQDMDGDGRADLLFALGATGGDGMAYATFAVDGGLVSLAAGTALSSPTSLPPAGPSVRWLDLDGDGRVDALQANQGGWTAWFNLGNGQLSSGTSLTPPQVGLSFEDPTVRLADMNGDGLIDLVQLQSGVARVFLNVGFGAFAAPVTLSGAPDVGGDDLRLMLGDADGDGLADVFYVAPGRLSIWRNLGGQGFGPEVAVVGAPDYDPISTTVRVADLLGRGVHGIVYAGGQAGVPFLWFFDPTAGVRPNLITGIDNGVGGTRSVSFQSSADQMLQAAAQGAPFTNVVPFPVQVVADVRQTDGVSPPQEERHLYRDPYWNPAERQFEGFGQSTGQALGDAHTAEVQTVVTLHTGEGEDLALVGKIATQEARAADGTLLQRTRTNWVAQAVAAGVTGPGSAFAAATEELVEEWEGQASARVQRVRRSYDVHGNVTDEQADGWLGPSPDPDAAEISSSYADDEGTWVLGKLAQREVRDASGTRTQAEQHYYDGAAFQGLPLGQLTAGDEMRRAAWISGTAFVDVKRVARDGFGNPTVWLDGDGRRVELDYDPLRHQFPTEERHFPTAAQILTFEVNVDPATGQALSYREPEGAVTHYGWDGLARLVTIERPTDPAGAPSEQRLYTLTLAERSLTRQRRSQPGGSFDVVDVDVFDGLLRPLNHAQSGEQQGQFAITKRALHDARGTIAKEFVPYYGAAPDAAPPATAAAIEDFRDPLGRTIHRILPAGGELLWIYGPGWLDSYDSLASAGEAEASRVDFTWRHAAARVTLDPNGARERHFDFVRDPAGKVLRRTVPSGAQASAVYDGLGRLVALIDPDAGKSTRQYDLAGHLVLSHDALGDALQWTFDGAGRVLTEADPQGVRATYCYDDPKACGGGTPSPARLLTVADRSGTTTFRYDGEGRVTGETIAQAGLSLSTGFTYDDADRLTALTYPDGVALDFSYGGRGLPIAVSGLLTAASYTAGGLPLRRTFANGAEVDVTRDVADRAVAISASVDEASVVATSYTLLSSGVPAQRVDAQGITDFKLDAAERLAAENGPFGQRRQAYDDDDRVIERFALPADSRLPGQALPYGQSAGPHALAQSGRGAIGYDTAGRRVTEGALDLGWDARGELTTVTSPRASAEYVYGFDGSRRSRTVQFSDGRRTAALDFGGYAEVRDGMLWKHVVVAGERIASLVGVLPPLVGH